MPSRKPKKPTRNEPPLSKGELALLRRVSDRITVKAAPAGSSRERREQETVRRFLANLADGEGNARPGCKSIDTISADWRIPSDDLRSFRDGHAEAIDPATVGLLNTLLGRDYHGMLGIDMDDSMGFMDPSNGGWYGAMLAEESIRQARMRTYQLIDRTRPEANAALHCWADMGVTGNLGEGERFQGGYQPVVYDAAQTTQLAVKKVDQLINGRLLPDDQKLLVFRGMVKYGDQWGEIGLEQRNGRFEMDRIYPRHARTMYVERTPDNRYNPRYAYKQILPGRIEPVAKFPEWKIAHFANTEGWGDVYGTSLFEPCLRSYIQIEAMEAAMIIRRLERASMRYKHTVDVGLIDGGDEAIKKYQRQYRNDHRKVRTVDGTRNFRQQKISMPPEEDFYIFKRDKDSPADIEPLVGDANIGQLDDVMHNFRKWLSGLGPPSSHLGYEDQASKSGVNDKHIVFARKVRRTQMKFISGLNHIYWVGLILRGIDPRTVQYTIFPPAMGTRDELIRAQVQLARATTIQYLSAAFGATGKVPSIEWMLKYILGMDDEVIRDDRLQLTNVIPKAGKNSPGFKNAPPKNVKDDQEDRLMAAQALQDPEVRKQAHQLSFVMEERALALRLPEAADAIRYRTLPSWHGDFDSVVRSMGVKELHRAE
jgi:hypothetical protein